MTCGFEKSGGWKEDTVLCDGLEHESHKRYVMRNHGFVDSILRGTEARVAPRTIMWGCGVKGYVPALGKLGLRNIVLL
jgi:hypothetical protein